MDLESIVSEDPTTRAPALAAMARAAEHERSSLAPKLGAIAREAAAAFESEGRDAGLRRFVRACEALAALRAPAARSCLCRIADEGAPAVKRALASALRGAASAEARSVLVHLLSDDDARVDAVAAIASAPWPEVLAALIEVAEVDDEAARLSALAIARIGATAGADERNAAADFLLEQLDDDALIPTTALAILRHGLGFPGVAARARVLAKEAGKRKPAGLCLVAACSDDGNAALLELALSGARLDADVARTFLAPLRGDPDERIRRAAERVWRALDLG